MIVGRPSVIDGDTLEIAGRRIRLHGIDAPEIGQQCRDEQDRPYHCGAEAANALDRRIGSQTVACEARGLDRYGRTLAICREGGEDLNRWMVAGGQAVAYRRYSHDYDTTEEEAHARRVGLWRGAFEMPRAYRHPRR